ncbi:MAG: efflux RND transporter periplasmic adaptor subunit [Deltaproteobacteria bacterium]|nr:efflux RND transporter periplasmic adaptor subunit [Deltaproteobacteria bacterium]
MMAVATAVSTAGPQEKGGGGRPPARVQVATVMEKMVVTRVTLVGTAEPWTETIVASEEAGLVRKMLVNAADEVKQNQTLCVQDATQLKLKIEAARAIVAEAEANKIRAEREWERQKRLYAINSVSKKAYEDAQFEAEAAVKRVARLQVELYTLLDQVKKKVIYAPVSGSVVARHTLVGQWLGQGDPVVTLAVLDPIRVMVPVPERYISKIKKGERCQVVFDALAGRVFNGMIDAIIPRADGAARTFPVRIEIANPKGTIKAGMLGRATLAVGNPHKAILVPKDALVLSGAGKSVYVINDRSAHLVQVKTGSAYGPLIEVEGALKRGQKVAVRGNERLVPGQRVTIVESAGRTGAGPVPK